MTYELIICEKPSQALKIAEALGDGKIKKHSEEKVFYYEVTRNNKKIFVASAVGHLFVLTEREKKGWTYPVFDIVWKETYKVRKLADFTKKYYDVLLGLAKEADSFVVACDFDIEGSLIGYNIIRFIANKKDAKRMKFSTMTKEELIESYENASNHLDFPQIESGETRHKLDFFYGISLSRALTISTKEAGSFTLMSIGRVQGPTLAILSQRELEIKKFKPEPYWEVELITDKLIAWHKKGRFGNKQETEDLIKRLKGKRAIISSITKTIKTILPPYPFDLTTLQLEAYKHLSFTPKQTLQLAQNLYIAGYISYPRTSSQKLPQQLGYKKILNKLSKQPRFSKLIKILPEKLIPREGPKTDPAHPAIFVTGELGKMKQQGEMLYELIARRFIATFGSPAKRETISVEIEVNNEIFITSGTRTIEDGWFVLYGKFAKFEEQTLPALKEKQELKVKEIKLHEKETQPPKRYTQASIIKELEKKSLGTKSTRSQILDTLYQRYYIQERSIEVTDLGLGTIRTLKKYVPEILDEKLTRRFEKELEEIQQKKKEPKKVLDEAQKVLTRVLSEFKKNELKIGKDLVEAKRETQAQASLIGKCPNCEQGLLNLRKGKFGLFVSCDKYEQCSTTFSVPQGAMIRPTKIICEHCKHPKISIIKQGKRPQEICINKECPSKKSDIKLDKNKKCPKCGGNLVIRRSIYNSFIGCEKYPDCRYIDVSKHRTKKVEKKIS